MEKRMYEFFIINNMAYPYQTRYGNRIKLNHPEIAPIYNAFKAAVTKGTSRSPLFAVTERELHFFEHILFTMKNYEDMSIAERCLYIERMVRRSRVYRDNLKKFSREKVRRNLEDAKNNAELKLRIYLANKS